MEMKLETYCVCIVRPTPKSYRNVFSNQVDHKHVNENFMETFSEINM